MANQGDSGTFGSRATMNAIGKMQQKKKPAVNMTKAMLTGKYKSPNVFGKVKKAAGKMFSN
jgi:hypothetical protein